MASEQAKGQKFKDCLRTALIIYFSDAPQQFSALWAWPRWTRLFHELRGHGITNASQKNLITAICQPQTHRRLTTKRMSFPDILDAISGANTRFRLPTHNVLYSRKAASQMRNDTLPIGQYMPTPARHHCKEG